ncbi:MAG: ISNCY family transposase, partial [Cyanobacteriota bacterium]
EGEQRGLLKGEQQGFLKGEQRGLLQGKQEGKREGKLEVAQRLLERGLPVSEVISITGLSAEDLQQISSKRQ